MTERETVPLPEDPALAVVARALTDAGQFAYSVDSEWRWVYQTDEPPWLRITCIG
jgi:hypothetical protein